MVGQQRAARRSAGRIPRRGPHTPVPLPALDHRRFWDAMHAVTMEQLEQASQLIAARIAQVSGVDVSSVALDMTNCATFIATANGRAPLAQRGKAKQKRGDLRLAGLGLVVTRDGGIPLTWHAHPGDKPDVTQFTGSWGRRSKRGVSALPRSSCPPGPSASSAPSVPGSVRGRKSRIGA